MNRRERGLGAVNAYMTEGIAEARLRHGVAARRNDKPTIDQDVEIRNTANDGGWRSEIEFRRV